MASGTDSTLAGVTKDADALAGARLVARGLSRRFGKRLAVSAVDLTLLPGRVVGLFGANGAGKSTLLALLAGHLQPSAGTVEWPGARQGGLRGRLGMLPQGAPLPVDETPRRILMHLARLQLVAQPAAAVDDVLDAVGLKRVAETRLRNLSGGERKLIGIAQAFLGQPEVVLLDEPTSALDPWGRQRLRSLVRGRREAGAAIVIASHNLAEAEQLCDEAVVLDAGRVAAAGPLAALLGPPGEVRFELGQTGRLPLEAIKAALPGVRTAVEGEQRSLVLSAIEPAARVESVVQTTYRLLGEAGVDVRRVITGRTLEAALTGPASADGQHHDGATVERKAADPLEG